MLPHLLFRLIRAVLTLALIPGAVMLDYSLAAARRAPAPYSGQDYVNERFSLLLGGASPSVLASPGVNPAFGAEPIPSEFPFLRAAQTIVNSYRALTGQGGSLASTDVAGEGSIVVPQRPSVTETVKGIAAIPDQLEEELRRTGGNAPPRNRNNRSRNCRPGAVSARSARLAAGRAGATARSSAVRCRLTDVRRTVRAAAPETRNGRRSGLMSLLIGQASA